MGASEFGEWMVWFSREQVHPHATRLRHAQLLAAAANGALTRPGKQLFAAAEFLADPWAPPEPPPEPLTAASVAAQVDALNARFD